MFRSRHSRQNSELHQRSKSDSGLSSNLYPLPDQLPNEKQNSKQKRPLVLLEKFRNFLKSSENLQTTTLDKRNTRVKQQQQQQHQQLYNNNSINNNNDHDHKSSHNPLHKSRINHPANLVERIFKSFKSSRTQSTFCLNDRFPYEAEVKPMQDKLLQPMNRKVFASSEHGNSAELRLKISNNHTGVLGHAPSRFTAVNQNLKSKTFVLIGSPRRKPRLQTPRARVVFPNWDEGQDSLVLGMPSTENMADRHALHKCRRWRSRRLRNAKVRRRLSFGDEVVVRTEGCLNESQVLLYHFPVAV